MTKNKIYIALLSSIMVIAANFTGIPIDFRNSQDIPMWGGLNFAQAEIGSNIVPDNCGSTPCPTGSKKYVDIKCKINLSDAASDGPCTIVDPEKPSYISWTSNTRGCVVESPGGSLNTNFESPDASVG